MDASKLELEFPYAAHALRWYVEEVAEHPSEAPPSDFDVAASD